MSPENNNHSVYLIKLIPPTQHFSNQSLHQVYNVCASKIQIRQLLDNESEKGKCKSMMVHHVL